MLIGEAPPRHQASRWRNCGPAGHRIPKYRQVGEETRQPRAVAAKWTKSTHGRSRCQKSTPWAVKEEYSTLTGTATRLAAGQHGQYPALERCVAACDFDAVRPLETWPYSKGKIARYASQFLDAMFQDRKLVAGKPIGASACAAAG